MAKILFIDDDPVAVKAMDGMIRRSPHSLLTMDHGMKAMARLSESVDCDIIVMELKLSESNTLQLLREIRENPFLKSLPIIIYSKVKDKDVVKSVLGIGVQNFFFKPYKEKIFFDEIDKHCKNDWRIELAGATKKFYRSLDTLGHSFYAGNKELLQMMEQFFKEMPKDKSVDFALTVSSSIMDLSDKALKVAYPLFGNMMADLYESARAGNQGKVYAILESFSYAVIMQKYRIEFIEKELNLMQEESVDDAGDEEEADHDLEITTHLTLDEVEARVEEIRGYPVMESAAAAFQMSTHDDDTNLDEIVEMIQRDSGLATSVLRFSNMSAVAPGTVIEDIHQAISVLGLKRVRLLALSLKTVPEMSSMFTAFRWENFWMHQVGCAMVAEEIATRLDLPSNSEIIYIAGLIHDLGKILLNEVDNKLYKQIVKYARRNDVALQVCEREHFSCSHEHVGLIFAKSSMMPEALQYAIKYQFEPQNAPEHKDVVGALSLANFLCMSYEIGDNGDRIMSKSHNLASHPAWEALDSWLTPGFSIARFTREMELRIHSLKVELIGLVQEQAEMKSH